MLDPMAEIQRRLLLATALGATRMSGANERVRVGLIGCGGRGRYVTRLMRDAGNCDVTAACDVYLPLAEKAREWAGGACRAYQDYRKLLESREVDAVVVATPDHWHSSIAVAACEAGKDVYVEKPLAYSVKEGRAIVEAARKTRRLVLPGTQHRSAEHYAEIAAMVRSGDLGEVRFVRVWNYSNMLPNGIGRAPDGEPPEGLDWAMYCGPAPKVKFNPKRFGPTFRWFKDYATGTISDFGVHRFDTVHQIMGQDAPRTVAASGGRYVLRDAGEMPDTLAAVYEYDGWLLNYEMSNINAHGLGRHGAGQRYYNQRGAEDRPHGEAYYGTKATVVADRIGYELWWEGDARPAVRKAARDATDKHAAHFVACVRGIEKPRATPETAQRATNIAHLGNIALATGAKLKWDAEKEVFAGNKEANARLERVRLT
jgi:predicted dehydrogenase